MHAFILFHFCHNDMFWISALGREQVGYQGNAPPHLTLAKPKSWF